MRRCAPALSPPPSALRVGLTLIELLVVIVILVTLVGGVLPVLSPNNDARRIREAARGLQTYVMQAQSHAARTGRPAGIAFRESSPGSGVALEVYQIEVPPPFAGFSQYSSARLRRVINTPGADPSMWIQLVLSNTLDLDKLLNPRVDLSEFTGIDRFPDRFIKAGDIVRVAGIDVRLLPGDGLTDDDGFYFSELPDDNGQLLIPCELVDENQTLPIVEPPYQEVPLPGAPTYEITSAKSYQIYRQPGAVKSSAAQPYQLPAGVCIDLQASGTEGGSTQTQFATAKSVDGFSGTAAVTKPRIKQVGVLFSPSGAIDSIYYNGTVFNRSTNNNVQDVPAPISDASKLFLLLGRVELGNVPGVLRIPGQEVTEGFLWELPREQTQGDRTELTEVQARINWLNLESRWLVLDARNGRMVVSENTFVDFRKLQTMPGLGGQFIKPGLDEMIVQAQAVREAARSMQQ